MVEIRSLQWLQYIFLNLFATIIKLVQTITITYSSMTSKSTHILIMPYPAQGHMIPILDLTHHLVLTGKFKITIVTTPQNLSIISPLVSLFPCLISPLIIPFPKTPGIPAGKENTKDLPPTSFMQLIPALTKLEEPLRHWFESHQQPPVAIISDLFLGWTHRFAVKMGIKRLVFTPSTAMGLSVIYSLWKNMPKEGGDVLFKDLPNSPNFPWMHLSPIYRSYVEGDADSETIKDGFRDDMSSWGLVINSFDGLDGVYKDHLITNHGYGDRAWSVGPLMPPSGLKDRGGSTSAKADEILSWLDKCGDDEVVYVFFGTQTELRIQQMEAIAEGLERSGVRFIWSVRKVDGEDNDLVPIGFEERMAGRGMVIRGWVPQALILKHQAVGSMLSHCGTNSSLEGIMAGVRLLAWPMGADQYSNAKLLVDYFKVGVRVCEGSNSVPNPSQLAQILAKSVKVDQVVKQRITNLQSNALQALSESGSSSTALASLVNKLCELNS